MSNEGTSAPGSGFELPDGRRVTTSPAVEALAREAVDAALAVHREFGPGLLESVYEACLTHELLLRGIQVLRQVPIPLEYRGVQIEASFRADLLLDSQLLIELKTADTILPIHRAQVITYLKLLKLPLGLLINFNSVLIKDGIERILNVPRRLS